jgi:hypothetical protein
LITNEFGERNYLSVTHYYQKIDYMTFKKKYDFDPVKDFFQLGKLEESVDKSDQKRLTKQQAELDMCLTFADNDYIYLPYAACLISKHPYIKQMERCIDAVLKISVDDNLSVDDLNKLVLHLIYEIPIPPPNKRLLFYIPYVSTPIEIYGKLIKDIPVFSNNLHILFNYFSLENLMLIHMMTLFEQKILFVHDDYKMLTEISQAFTSLLYPMIWTHIYIPILTEDTIKYVLAPMPYIMGVEESMMNYVKKQLDDNKDNEEDNYIFIVYIKKNLIEHYSNRKIKKVNKKFLYQYIPEYPESLYDDIVKELKEMKKAIDEVKDLQSINMTKIDKKILSLFVKTMVFLFGDYKKYVSVIDNQPLLNTLSFLSGKAEKSHKFYKELTDNQNFRHFLQNKQSFPYFEKMCIRYSHLMLPVKKDNSRPSSVTRSNSLIGSGKNTPKKFSIFGSRTPNLSLKKYTSINMEDSNSSSRTDMDNRSAELIDTYLITQYYTQDSLFRLDSTKIEEYLNMKYKSKYFFNSCRCE